MQTADLMALLVAADFLLIPMGSWRLKTSQLILMSEKKYEWHLIAQHGAELDWNSNNIAVVEVKGKKICISKMEEQWFAFAYKCPHAGALLSYGHIDAACNIVCPVHRYKFNLRNGYNSSGEGYYLKTYPIKQSEEGLFVGMPEGGLLGWL